MKKLIIALFVSFLLINNVVYWAQCDQTFPSKKLRYGYIYTFHDDFHNSWTAPLKIKWLDVEFTQKSNYWVIPKFGYTDWIKGKKWIMNPWESGKVAISNEYSITRHPVKREDDNIYIRYVAKYIDLINGKESWPIKEHTECQPYSISWCWDGILDRDYGETCDPMDPTKTGWWSGWCSIDECKPVDTPKPKECKVLTADPKSGNFPLKTNFNCEWVNTSTYKIDIKDSTGKVINTINSKSGSYEFTTAGNYTATCYADGLTAASCEQKIDVTTTPNKECKVLNANPTSGNFPLKTEFSCEWVNTSNYKIEIKDSTGKVINTINNRTGSYEFTTAGNYTATCYADGLTSASCEQKIVPGNPPAKECKVLNMDPKNHNNSLPFEPNFSCEWTNTSNYRIEIKDSTGKILETINNRTGKYKFDKYWNYTATCYADNLTSSGCEQKININPGGSPNGSCDYLNENHTERNDWYDFSFECRWSSSDYRLEIRDLATRNTITTLHSSNWRWDYRIPKDWRSYEFKCYSWNASNNKCERTFTPWRGPNSNPGGGWSRENPRCWDWIVQAWEVCERYDRNWRLVDAKCSDDCRLKDDYCGDWIVQRPNSKWQMEICDLWSRNGQPDSWCTADCKVRDLTIPWEKYFKFGPQSINVIGSKMNPYTTYGDMPSLTNMNAKDEIYVYEICVTNKSNKFKSWNSIQVWKDWSICQIVDKVLKPWETVSMTKEVLDVVAMNLPKWTNQEDNVIVTTIKTDRGDQTIKFRDSAFFSSWNKFKARVSRSSISTTWGWVSYVSDNKAKNISNVAKVTSREQGDVNRVKADNNNNFVWLAITEFLSSYATKTLGEDVVKKDTYDNRLINYDPNIKNTWEKITALSEFKKYNWITWAYIIRGKWLEINSLNKEEFQKIKEPTTYIIEWGDLTIKENIEKIPYNIAFVVKWWNILIWDKVNQINWTYIAIPNGREWGYINWIGDSTSVQLVINGSLYGDISDLTAKRTYMKVNKDWQLDVWTVVSYGSSVFRKPAPLTSTFIEEYVKATKVAR